MASPDRDERAERYALLVDVLDDPTSGRERLPRIVRMFESDDRQVRMKAAFACALVANELEDDDTIEYLVRRLSDRLDAEFVSLELTTTLDYISNRYSEQVERVLQEMDEGERERGEIPLPEVGNFTRSHYYNQESDRQGVGRTRVAGAGGTDDPRRSYADSEQEEREVEEYEQNRDGDGGAGEEEDEEEEEPFGAMGQQRTEVASIATRSRFDKLHILAARDRERYADIYEALVGRSGEEKAVSLRLFHRPDDSTEHIEFADRMETELGRWHAVSDHAHVNSVLDWSVEPRPWAATLFAGDSLAEFGRVPAERTIGDAINLADAVSHLHRNGVVHAGIDPGNVAYPGALVEEGGQEPPLLDNVGLMHAVRHHFEPALHLDPRFSAPEYFDQQFGSIDHATDIYQLGAVIHHMFTGRPPYTGEFEQVREAVLEDQPPAPTDHGDDVPPELDDLVAKAMAKQKLTRYETVEHLQQDLVGIRGDEDG